MESERLRYTALEPSHLDAFHGLVRDDHIRRYLIDGVEQPREWSAERIRDSQALFDRRGVGIWLVTHKSTGEIVGFCGFLELPDTHPDPQLVYAMREKFTGNGYATEMTRTSIAAARARDGFATIVTDVDAVNTASVRILEKLGFDRISSRRGAFGEVFLYRLDGPAS